MKIIGANNDAEEESVGVYLGPEILVLFFTSYCFPQMLVCALCKTRPNMHSEISETGQKFSFFCSIFIHFRTK